jgi:hypothetical protein
MENSIRDREIFTELSAPQDRAKGVTSIVDIFEQCFDKGVEEIVNATNR